MSARRRFRQPPPQGSLVSESAPTAPRKCQGARERGRLAQRAARLSSEIGMTVFTHSLVHFTINQSIVFVICNILNMIYKFHLS